MIGTDLLSLSAAKSLQIHEQCFLHLVYKNIIIFTLHVHQKLSVFVEDSEKRDYFRLRRLKIEK